ncbi:MAG: hypothetical protein Q8R51_02745 [Azonexus sp.]|nr:hypothetical protein [Azonexus sp.]
MRKLIIASLLSITFLAACGPTPLGYTVTEFDNAIEKLYGKSPEEVAQVIGKPAQFNKSTLDNGQSFDCFGYEGVKDVATGKLSRATTICFLGGKLAAKKPSYSF